MNNPKVNDTVIFNDREYKVIDIYMFNDEPIYVCESGSEGTLNLRREAFTFETESVDETTEESVDETTEWEWVVVETESEGVVWEYKPVNAPSIYDESVDETTDSIEKKLVETGAVIVDEPNKWDIVAYLESKYSVTVEYREIADYVIVELDGEKVAGQPAPADESVDDTDGEKFALDCIRVHFSESSILNDKVFYSFDEFNQAVREVARTYEPDNLAYDKTDIKVEFNNGDSYGSYLAINREYIDFDIVARMIQYIQHNIDEGSFGYQTDDEIETAEAFIERLKSLDDTELKVRVVYSDNMMFDENQEFESVAQFEIEARIRSARLEDWDMVGATIAILDSDGNLIERQGITLTNKSSDFSLARHMKSYLAKMKKFSWVTVERLDELQGLVEKVEHSI